jgi:2-polyprenyl-3-methyl-5-hydroxy-6-metoxy-1,4-benzoquinol methylase
MKLESLIVTTYPGETEYDIAFFMDQIVKNGADTKQEARKHAINSYFYQGDEKASKAILDVISKDVNDPPARKYSTQSPVSKDHTDSLEYWLNAKTTYLAPETYYQKQEEVLRSILCKYAIGKYAVDIGCGNGRFTQIIGEYFSHTEAIDPSKMLIEEAFENATKAGVSNISYIVDNLENSSTLSTYDFVSCMGVTSGLIDDEVFIRSIWKLKAAMKPRALLLMKDSLSLSIAQLIKWNGYTAVYRNIDHYLESFTAVGLQLVEQNPLSNDKDLKRMNSLFLFQVN